MLSRRTKVPLLDRGPWLVGKSNGSQLASRLWILNKLKDMGTVWCSGYFNAMKARTVYRPALIRILTLGTLQTGPPSMEPEPSVRFKQCERAAVL